MPYFDVELRDGVLRAARKLSPDKPRPLQRARDEAIDHLDYAFERLAHLVRELRETGSESELALAAESFVAVQCVLGALRQVGNF